MSGPEQGGNSWGQVITAHELLREHAPGGLEPIALGDRSLLSLQCAGVYRAQGPYDESSPEAVMWRTDIFDRLPLTASGELGIFSPHPADDTVTRLRTFQYMVHSVNRARAPRLILPLSVFTTNDFVVDNATERLTRPRRPRRTPELFGQFAGFMGYLAAVPARNLRLGPVPMDEIGVSLECWIDPDPMPD